MLDKDFYKNYLSSEFLKDIIQKNTCKICGEIDIQVPSVMEYHLYYGASDTEDHICQDCKLKNERNAKINDILK